MIKDGCISPRVVLHALLVTVGGLFWVSIFWMQPARQWPLWGEFYCAADWFLTNLFGVSGMWGWVLESYLFTLVPVAILVQLGRPARAMGLGGIPKRAWGIMALGFSTALPVLVWLGLNPDIQMYYAHMFRLEGWASLLSSAFVIVPEHVLIQGVILSLALPSGRLPINTQNLPPGEQPTILGIESTASQRRVFSWLRVPSAVWPALIGQALVFGAVHAGKEISELMTAFVGGLGLGFITYCMRSLWPGVLLHIGAGAVVLGIIYITH